MVVYIGRGLKECDLLIRMDTLIFLPKLPTNEYNSFEASQPYTTWLDQERKSGSGCIAAACPYWSAWERFECSHLFLLLFVLKGTVPVVAFVKASVWSRDMLKCRTKFDYTILEFEFRTYHLCIFPFQFLSCTFSTLLLERPG